jgi:ORF6N domain
MRSPWTEGQIAYFVQFLDGADARVRGVRTVTERADEAARSHRRGSVPRGHALRPREICVRASRPAPPSARIRSLPTRTDPPSPIRTPIRRSQRPPHRTIRPEGNNSAHGRCHCGVQSMAFRIVRISVCTPDPRSIASRNQLLPKGQQHDADDRYSTGSAGPLRESAVARSNKARQTGDAPPLPAVHIAQSILFLRGRRVILDRELAAIYGVETRKLNQAVKRNSVRFPEDFMFQLDQAEAERSRSQAVIRSGCSRSGARHAARSAGG